MINANTARSMTDKRHAELKKSFLENRKDIIAEVNRCIENAIRDNQYSTEVHFEKGVLSPLEVYILNSILSEDFGYNASINGGYAFDDVITIIWGKDE